MEGNIVSLVIHAVCVFAISFSHLEVGLGIISWWDIISHHLSVDIWTYHSLPGCETAKWCLLFSLGYTVCQCNNRMIEVVLNYIVTDITSESRK